MWRISWRDVALGAAGDSFFGLLIPLAQQRLSADSVVALRVRLPAAPVSTLASNAVYFAPLDYLAYLRWCTPSSM